MYANLPTFRKVICFLPIIPGYILIFFIMIVSFFYFTNITNFNLFGRVLLTTIQYINVIMTVYTHILSIITNPGNVPVDYSNLTNEQSGLFCNKCKKHRPPRSHHCRKCNKCILKMDHHCPWIANCVGFYNQKYFCLFTYYSFLSSFFFIISHIVILAKYKYILDEDKEAEELAFAMFLKKIIPFIIVLFSFFALIFLFCVSGFKLYRNIKMLLHNSTLIEERIYAKKEDNTFYDKNEFQSFKMVMGEKWYQWFIPKFSIKLGNDGFCFDKNAKKIEIQQVQNKEPEKKGEYNKLDEFSNRSINQKSDFKISIDVKDDNLSKNESVLDKSNIIHKALHNSNESLDKSELDSEKTNS